MGIEENKVLMRRFYELLNQHDVDAANELISMDFHSKTITREQLIQFAMMALKAFPDLEETIVDMIAEGDKVAYIVNFTGTHTDEPYMGIQPTGKKVDVNHTWHLRVADNKIVEWNGTGDYLTLFQQLGVLPSGEEFIQAYNDSLK